MSKSALPRPPDQAQRDLILNALHSSMLVEAAAGTGKTTSMVGRMTALLRTGACQSVRNLAAVTFTRKAAAELRGRFQGRLERGVREAQGEERARLRDALENVDQCFIGTIHSFCGRLLRERPVEAGVDPAFQEIDQDMDGLLRQEAWELGMARFIAGEDEELVERLNWLGMRPGELKNAFLSFADYPDVDEWPAEEVSLDPAEVDAARRELERYVAHMASLFPKLPAEWGNDTLIPKYRSLPRHLAHYPDLGEPRQLMAALAAFDKGAKIVQKMWKEGGRFTGDDAKAELARWEAFAEEFAAPLRRRWSEMRYGPCLRALEKAREAYDRLREERGVLNFQDLLMRAAALLRNSRPARAYFARRFTHLLVDEFQDTDPIQAEVMMLLTSRDLEESRWRRCRPRPGSLFVVGDPKQSIYRFRRADIVTYNEVKGIIADAPEGAVVELSANFRTSAPVIDWVNAVFCPGGEEAAKGKAMLRFPEAVCDESPAYVPLQAARLDGSAGPFSEVRALRIPKEITSKGAAAEYEADAIARTIRRAIDERLPMPRRAQEVEEGAPLEAVASDFMIVTRNTTLMSVYAKHLQRLGVPHQVTGGTALNETRELKLLLYALKAAAYPHDPVALVAALRSELFGVSDAALYAFKKAGGCFDFRRAVPEGFADDGADALRDAFGLLGQARAWLSRRPVASAIERLARALGLPALAASREGGDIQAGGLAKGMELLRQASREAWSVAQVVERLEEIVNTEQKYDGVSARSEEPPAVRVMNLHKVKGLEAPVVFLADTSGESNRAPTLRVDRSGEKTAGYMVVQGGELGYGRRETLAQPPDWERHEEIESAFQAAEDLRLRYVAATRAGAAMLVAQRDKGNSYNPWKHFDPFLQDAEPLPDPGPQSAPVAETTRIAPSAAGEAKARAAAGLRRIEAPTFATRGAKAFALSGAAQGGAEDAEDAMRPSVGNEGEHGLEWGEAIHSLLELALAQPGADLDRAAAAQLREHGLDEALANTAAAVARAVLGSEIWRRAQAASLRFAEAPFQVLRESDGLPTVVRGAIDLAFREEKGWVIVDYKTDRVQGAALQAAADRYAPQVHLYADAWEQCSGEKVAEAGILFLSAGQYAKVKR